MRVAKVLLILFISFFSYLFAYAESVSIPFNVIHEPAVDLIDLNGQPGRSTDKNWVKSNFNQLYLMNPIPNKIWNGQAMPVQDGKEMVPPQAVMEFREVLADALTRTYMYLVKYQGRFYRLSLSTASKSVLMRTAMMRKLGYYAPTAQYSNSIRLKFASEVEKKSQVDRIQEGMKIDVLGRKWIVSDPKDPTIVIIHDAVIEPYQKDYFVFNWGLSYDPDDSGQSRELEYLSTFRAYRALIALFVLPDLPESLNRFSPDCGSLLYETLTLYHPSAKSFRASSIDDVQWVMQRIAHWKDEDFAEVVRAAQFPAAFQNLALQILKNRAECLISLSGLKNKTSFTTSDIRQINDPSGLVVDGKVTQEMIEGSPLRWAHGDRESPVEDGDIYRYLNVRGISAAVATAVEKLEEKLQIKTIEDLQKDYLKDFRDSVQERIRTRPWEPIYRQKEAWGGTVGGFTVSAARHVTTGTYYESQAPIQIVDNISVGANIGHFRAIAGIEKYTPSRLFTLGVQRDYTHVKPIASMEEGRTLPWQNLLVKSYFNKLVKVLNEEKDTDGRFALDAFLAELKTNEIFSITDSVVTGAYGQVSSSFDVLMGISPLKFINSLAAGLGFNRLNLRQLTVSRTKQGLQIYLRSQNQNILNSSVNANYFLNIVKATGMKHSSSGKTAAYLIDYETGMSDVLKGADQSKALIDFEKNRNELRLALLPLIRDGETELLTEKFKNRRMDVTHQWDGQQFSAQVLAWKANQFSEGHKVAMTLPENPDHPELKRENEIIELYSHTRGELKGRDLLGLGLEFLSSWFRYKNSKSTLNLASGLDPNPANTPFGEAYWKLITADADLTKKKPYPSVAKIENIWGGWDLDREEFLKLLSDIEMKLGQQGFSNYRLLPPNKFAHVKSLDFYRITATLSILPAAYKRIRDLIQMPMPTRQPCERATYLAGIFKRLSQIVGDGYQPKEKDLFEQLLVIYGGGDRNDGWKKYTTICKEDWDVRGGVPPGFWRNGNNYECLATWVDRLMSLSQVQITNKEQESEWITEVIQILDSHIPRPLLLRYLGPQTYAFSVSVNGFRTGDEDGDLQIISNTLGDPADHIEFANGLLNKYSLELGLSPVELSKTIGGYK